MWVPVWGGEKEKRLQGNFCSWDLLPWPWYAEGLQSPVKQVADSRASRIVWAESSDTALHRTICSSEFIVTQSMKLHHRQALDIEMLVY